MELDLESPVRATDIRLLDVLDGPVWVGDVGCRAGIDPAWLRFGDHVRVVGFDPDPDECARLAGSAPPGVRFEPRALAEVAGPRPLHVTADPACSSLYPPGPAVRSHPALAVARPERIATAECTTLDDWCAANRVGFDVLKIDAQGAALDVLRGARGQLSKIVGLEVEVEFNPIYVGQPLFADVDALLRAHGFVLWRLRHLVHYSMPDPPDVELFDAQFFDDVGVPIPARGGQLFWGMATYVRGDAIAEPAPRSRAHHARNAVVFDGLGMLDLAARAARSALA